MTDSVRLTRDAAVLLVRIYQRYLNSKHDGMNDLQSRYIGDSFNVVRIFALPFDVEYATDLLFELSDAGYISAGLGNNVANECTLERAGVARMESLWVDSLGSLAKALTEKAFSAMIQVLS